MATRQLFPHLPAELRLEIYNYLHTTSTKLTLPLKTLTTSHTVVQICAVQHANTALLALSKYRFLEAQEYTNWLLAHATEIWIGVHFVGHVHTFVQEHWDKKVRASLNKMAKAASWFAAVCRYRVRFVWEPKTHSGMAKRGVGDVVNGMVRTLCGVRDPGVARRKGDLGVGVCVGGVVGLGAWRSVGDLGLETFLSGGVVGVCGKEVRDVRVASCRRSGAGRDQRPQGKLRDVVASALPMSLIRVSDDGSVFWDQSTEGRLVMRRVIVRDESWRKTGDLGFGGAGKGGSTTDEQVWMALYDECKRDDNTRIGGQGD